MVFLVQESTTKAEKLIRHIMHYKRFFSVKNMKQLKKKKYNIEKKNKYSKILNYLWNFKKVSCIQITQLKAQSE